MVSIDFQCRVVETLNDLVWIGWVDSIRNPNSVRIVIPRENRSASLSGLNVAIVAVTKASDKKHEGGANNRHRGKNVGMLMDIRRCD